MKRLPCLLSVLLLAGPTLGVRAENHWRTPAENPIYAQRLVDHLMATHPELLVIGLHAVPPGSKTEVMFATNLDRVGKEDDADDIGVVTEHKIAMAPNLTDPGKYEIEVPMLDASGHYIGGAAFVFKYHPGADLVALLARALAIRDELAAKTPALSALFAPAP